MSKKKILFIISNLETGGVSKSLTSLLNVIDRERYDISLMICSPTGAFMELLPNDIRLITNPIWSALVSRAVGIRRLLKLKKPLLALGHFIRLCISCVSKARAAEFIAKLMPGLDEKFDVIVDFNGQQQLYYMVRKLTAKKKITFFHSDYSQWSYYYKTDCKYFPRADHIFSISDQCVEALKRFFPEQTAKISLMENISSLSLISKMATAQFPEMNDNIPTLLTIGHVCENKGFLWALDAAQILRDKGVIFRWYFIGKIAQQKEYTRLIEIKKLTEHIIMLGIRTNPYPYISKATIVVHPSKFEGKSIALDEAKLLCKPIVVTNFSTVHDQFVNRHNASICKMIPQSIADAIEELLYNEDLRKSYTSSLLTERQDNSSELEKLYQIFDE